MIPMSELSLAELRSLARSLRLKDAESFDKDALRKSCRIELARQYATRSVGARLP